MPNPTPNKVLRIGTRGSKLALIQAEYVKGLLVKHYPDIAFEIIPISTSGDRIQDKPLYDIGGKGLFLKEIEEALLKGSIDIAVHSLKDVPGVIDERFSLACMLPRAAPQDVLISYHYKTINDLPDQALVGTSSPRRAALIRHHKPNITIVPIRGNVQTRIGKLDVQSLDAIILAKAGIDRLELLNEQTMHVLPCDTFTPAVGQGTIAIEILKEHHELVDILAPLNDPKNFICGTAERLFLAAFETGSCRTPIAAHAYFIDDDHVHFTGLIASPQGNRLLKETITCHYDHITDQVTSMVASFKVQSGDHFFDAL